MPQGKMGKERIEKGRIWEVSGNSDFIIIYDFVCYMTTLLNTPKATQMDNNTLQLEINGTSKHCYPPLIKIKTSDGFDMEHLRLYYRAAIKGLNSLKLYREYFILLENNKRILRKA